MARGATIEPHVPEAWALDTYEKIVATSSTTDVPVEADKDAKVSVGCWAYQTLFKIPR